MSDDSGNGVSVLCCVSGCYAEVHISWEIKFYFFSDNVIGNVSFQSLRMNQIISFTS